MRASSDDNLPSKDTRATGRSKTRRMLNVPLLVGTLIALVILGPAAFCWHRYQARHVASGFVDQANGELSDWAVGVFRRDDKSPLAGAARQEADAARKELPEWVVEEISSGEEPALTEAAQKMLAEWVFDLVLTDEKPALAAAARQEVDWAAAAGHLHRYLRLHPDDVDMRVRMAMTFDQSVKDPRHKWGVVKNHYYPVLGVVSGSKYAEKESDLRRRLAELLIETRQFASAESEVEKLLEANDKDPRARRLLARALYGEFQSGALVARPQGSVSVSEAFERALALSPKDVQLAAALARIYRDKDKEELLSDEKRVLSLDDREELANEVVDQMVTANPKSPEAFLARYRYRVQYGLAGAKDDLNSALEHGPDNLAVLLVAAEHARREANVAQQAVVAKQEGASQEEVAKHLHEARECYQHVIKLSPSGGTAYLGLGNVYLAQGETDQAIETWRLGLKNIDQQRLDSNLGLLPVFADLSLRLADALIAQGRLREAWAPDADLEKAEERARAERTPLYNRDVTIRRFAPRLRRPYVLSLDRGTRLVQAKWFVRNQDYGKAIPLLKELTSGVQGTAADPAQGYQACAVLSQAYGALGEWGHAAQIWERAASLQPNLPSPRVQAASAWRRAGRLDLAIRQYELALAVTNDPEIRYELVATQFSQQAGLPKQQRNWELFDPGLGELKKPDFSGKLADAWRVTLLEVGSLLVRAPEEPSGDGPKAAPSPTARAAKGLLDKAETGYPNSPSLFRELVVAYERLGYQDDADRALATFRKLTTGSPAGYLLGSGILCGRKQYEEARELVREGIQELSPESHGVLQGALCNISFAEGGVEAAEKKLVELHKTDPSNIDFIWRLADLALQTHRSDDLRRWESKLIEAEGANGLNWRYCRARRLLNESLQVWVEARGADRREIVMEARAKVAALVRQAETLCSDIRKQRPTWGRAHELHGRVLQQQAALEKTAKGRGLKYQKAVDAYQKAIGLGAEQIAVYERVIPLLHQLQRSEEADRYLARLKSRGVSSQNLLQYEISAAERQGGLAEAIGAADRAMKARPGDVNARIWYGRLLLADGQQEAAEAALRQAVELAPTDARPYGALLDFYVRTQQRERAEETLEELGKNARLPGLQLALTGADLYARLGDLRSAEAKYREAEKLAGDNIPLKVNIKYRLAAIFSRSDLAEVEKLLREILELAPESDAARQRLAGLLAQRALASPGGQDEKVWQEIQQLLQQSSSGGKASSSRQRVQALLWLARGGKDDLERAERFLEKLIEDATGNADPDRFYLAMVYKSRSEPYRAGAERYEKLRSDAEEYERLKADPEQLKKLQADAPEHLEELKGAAKHYEKLSGGNNLSKADRELVASHQQYTRLFGKSREQFLAIVAREEPNPFYLESYIELLFRHKQALPPRLKDEALPWLKKLETVVTQPRPNAALLQRYFGLLRRHDLEEEAGQWLTGLEKVLPDNLYVLALRARWLQDSDRGSEIGPTVEQFAGKLLKALEKDGQIDPEKESQLCLSVGNVYTAVEQHQAAERWYRRLAKLLPERYEPLAISLARQGRHSEAIDICLQEAAKPDSPPRPAGVLASVLTIGKPTDKDFERARPLLDKAAEDHKDNAGLLTSLANVRIIEQRTDEAVRLYREVLKLRPKDAVILNNLATVLAERADTRKDALRYIEKAIRIAGPQPQYLDTKGTILILGGKPDEAAECLEKAASAPRPDPRYHLHLAVAYLQLGEDEKARDAHKNALAGDLTSRILMPTDEKYLSELKQKLGQ